MEKEVREEFGKVQENIKELTDAVTANNLISAQRLTHLETKCTDHEKDIDCNKKEITNIWKNAAAIRLELEESKKTPTKLAASLIISVIALLIMLYGIIKVAL